MRHLRKNIFVYFMDYLYKYFNGTTDHTDTIKKLKAMNEYLQRDIETLRECINALNKKYDDTKRMLNEIMCNVNRNSALVNEHECRLAIVEAHVG